VSQASAEAIADTSFLVDWARYGRRDLIFQVFDVVYVPESVLRELKYPPAVDWVAESMASDKMALFTETAELEEETRHIMAMGRGRPLKRIDFPEALCLAADLKFGYVWCTRLLPQPWRGRRLRGRGFNVASALELLYCALFVCN